jgi:hypothetical protein
MGHEDAHAGHTALRRGTAVEVMEDGAGKLDVSQQLVARLPVLDVDDDVLLRPMAVPESVCFKLKFSVKVSGLSV